MKRNKLFLISILMLILVLALIACNAKGSGGGTSNDELEYPMTKLPTDLVKPNGYTTVDENYADGYKCFTFLFTQAIKAAEQKNRLEDDLISKGYTITVEGAVSTLNKEETEIKLRQTVEGEKSKLFISVPYNFKVTNLPAEVKILPIFNGFAFNVPTFLSEEIFNNYVSVDISIDYFRVNYLDGFAFCRYLELANLPTEVDGKFVKIETDDSNLKSGKLKVTYSVAGFENETEWKKYKESLEDFNYEDRKKAALEINKSEYIWIDKSLEIMGYPELLATPQKDVIFNFSKSGFRTDVDFLDLTRDEAVNYINKLMNGDWQNVPYIDNVANTPWETARATENFEVTIRFKLLLAKFKWTGSILKMTLERVSPQLGGALMEQCKNYRVEYQYGDTFPYISTGTNYNFQTTQNGGLVGNFASSIFDSSQFFDFQSKEEFQYCDGFRAFNEMEDKVLKGTANLLGRDVSIYEGKLNGATKEIYVDKLGITLKIVNSTTSNVEFNVLSLEFYE